MKKFSLILIALIVFVGCDQGQKMVAPVMTGDPPPSVQDFPNEKTIPTRVTFGNVLDLQVGEMYKMRPTSYIQRLSGVRDAHTISELFFSNVRDRLTAAPPAIEARFILTPAPYMQKSERELVIKSVASGTDSRVYDEILIEITQKKEHGEKRGFRYVIYEAVAIENLTNPDLKFKYEPPPVQDFPREKTIPTRVTFGNVLDLHVGERYKIRPTSYVQSLAGVWHAHKISELFFSNVRDRLTAAPPAIEARFILTPAPYMQKSERELVIKSVASGTDSRVYDEILIEITQKKEHGEKRGFRYVIYEAVAIENLTNPDLKFEYE